MTYNEIAIGSSALPGDMILYASASEQGIEDKWSTVKSVNQVEAPNNGKNWVYETLSGEIVPFESIKEVKKKAIDIDNKMATVFQKAFQAHELYSVIENSDIPTSMKTAILCVILGDIKNLEVAAFLISQRAQQFRLIESTPNFSG